MGTMELQQPHRAAPVTEHQKILAQDAQTPRQVAQSSERMTGCKRPQVFAAWCPG